MNEYDTIRYDTIVEINVDVVNVVRMNANIYWSFYALTDPDRTTDTGGGLWMCLIVWRPCSCRLTGNATVDGPEVHRSCE